MGRRTEVYLSAIAIPASIVFLMLEYFGYVNWFSGFMEFFHELGHWALYLGAASIDGNYTTGYWSGIFPEFGGLLSLSAVSLGLGIFGVRRFMPAAVYAMVSQVFLVMEVFFGGQFDGDKSGYEGIPFVWPLVSLACTAMVFAVIVREAKIDLARFVQKSHAGQERGRRLATGRKHGGLDVPPRNSVR